MGHSNCMKFASGVMEGIDSKDIDRHLTLQFGAEAAQDNILRAAYLSGVLHGAHEAFHAKDDEDEEINDDIDEAMSRSYNLLSEQIAEASENGVLQTALRRVRAPMSGFLATAGHRLLDAMPLEMEEACGVPAAHVSSSGTPVLTKEERQTILTIAGASNLAVFIAYDGAPPNREDFDPVDFMERARAKDIPSIGPLEMAQYKDRFCQWVAEFARRKYREKAEEVAAFENNYAEDSAGNVESLLSKFTSKG